MVPTIGSKPLGFESRFPLIGDALEERRAAGLVRFRVLQPEDRLHGRSTLEDDRDVAALRRDLATFVDVGDRSADHDQAAVGRSGAREIDHEAADILDADIGIGHRTGHVRAFSSRIEFDLSAVRDEACRRRAAQGCEAWRSVRQLRPDRGGSCSRRLRRRARPRPRARTLRRCSWIRTSAPATRSGAVGSFPPGPAPPPRCGETSSCRSSWSHDRMARVTSRSEALKSVIAPPPGLSAAHRP